MNRIKTSILFLLLICICQSGLLAQSKTNKIIDSILIILKTAKEDTVKVKNMIELGSQYRVAGDFKMSLQVQNEALALAEKLHFKKGAASAFSGIGRTYRTMGNNTEALKKYTASLSLWEEISDKKGIAYTQNNIGVIYRNLGNYPEALKRHETALAISRAIGDSILMASVLEYLGILYRNKENYVEALKNHFAALKIREKLNDKPGLAGSYGGIGNIYRIQGNYTSALNYQLMALKFYTELGDKQNASVSYNSIGNIYAAQGNRKEALNYFTRSLMISREIGDKRGAAVALGNIGNINREEGNYPESLKNLLEALKLHVELGNKREIAINYYNLGTTYSDQKNFSEALKYFNSCIQFSEEYKFKDILYGTYISLAQQLIKQADNDKTIPAKENYAQALIYAEKGLALAKETGDKVAEKSAYDAVAEAYKSLNNYSKAFEYKSLYTALNDSLINNETTRKLEQQRISFEVDKALTEEKLQQEKLFNEKNALHSLELAEEKLKKEKAIEVEKLKYEFALTEEKAMDERNMAEQEFINEKKLADEKTKHEKDLTDEKIRQERKQATLIALQEKEKAEQKRKNEFLLIGLAIVGIISFFIVLLLRQRNLKRRAIEKADTAHKMSELELQSLRAQLNPHFMFNSLNAIQDLIVHEENDRSHLYLSRFSKLLRLLLENANQPFVTIKQELDFLELYLSLENLRIPDLQFSIEKDPVIDTGDRMIPNMMLQPYIENAIWHGLSHKEGNRKLQIRIRENGNATEFEIEDNGVGRKKAAEMKSLFRKGHTSKGMELLSKRFSLLSKEYGAAIQTTITDIQSNGDATGTLVKIDVPFSLSEQAKQ